jgi:mannose-6-phosphate isomerase-like protein (cupin superfamily)
MDKIKNQILKELLPAEKDVAPPAASARAGGKKPALHPDHWTSAVLLERAAYLHKLARQGDGSAGETLNEYPRHCAILSFRSRDGEAEIHENFADVFFVLEGRTTLVTGGTVAGARLTKPGETRGASIEGGARQELRAGDVAHVPAGLPHQMLVAGEQTVTCLVLKVQENL